MDLPSSGADNTAASTLAFVGGLGKNSEKKGREDLSPKCPDLRGINKFLKISNMFTLLGEGRS